MAIVSQAYRAATGTREDLSDQIHRVDVEETPFIGMVGSKKAKQRKHDWQTEALDPIDEDNAHPTAFETSRQPANDTTRLDNQCQISTRNATVSGTVEAEDRAGRSREMARQMAIKTIALRKDMEFITLSNQAQVTTDTDANPRKTRALEAWIRTNSDRGTGGADPADPNTTPGTNATDGTQRAFTEQMLLNVHQQCWSAGGNPKVVLLGGHTKVVASSFAGRASARQNIGERKIHQATNMYASDFGDLRLMAHRYLRDNGRTALLLDPKYIKIAYLRKFKRESLGRVGDAETRQILSEYSIEMCNERAHGVIADLATS